MENNSLLTKHSLAKEPIAIVGMSCRFPQVENLDEFWNLLIEGRDTIEEISRWEIDKYFSPDKNAKNKTHQKHSSLFKETDLFDPLFFNISPAEASEMTPSQKLVLELAWEAVENSSIPVDRVTGTKAGVYIGNIWNDFEHLRKHKNAEITLHSAIGQSSNVIANRISYFLGLTGPSLVVDTGCSTSLVALHLACQSLWDGSTEIGFAGGVNHILDPDQNLLLSKFGGLSAKGKCSTFDEGVDGFVRGEGGGMVLLKRLSDAERDGDYIHAVIRGSAVNNNGFNVNLPATSTKGQLDALEEAYRGSGVEPSEVHYVETHGTGTKLGDPTECNAIGHFFNSNRSKPLALGSVKTNLGHTEAVAGIAGLIKTTLAIKNKILPKNLNFSTPNPEIDFDGHNLKVLQENSSWPAGSQQLLRAGVNSFGWGGTNAHVVVEEYPNTTSQNSQIKKSHSKKVLPASAKSVQAVQDLVNAYHKQLSSVQNAADRDAVLAAAAIRKPQLGINKLFVADNQEQLLSKLGFALDHDELQNAEIETSKVVFVFPGQGSQWLGMGKELYQSEPVFKKIIDQCEKAFEPFTDWSLIEQMHADEDSSRLSEICVIQPSLFAMQVALAGLWQSMGVIPDALVGHSMGEVASAYASGALDLADAARIICTRSKLMQTVSGQGGAMAVTELTVEQATKEIEAFDTLSIAVNNSPKSTVIAGDQGEINSLLESLEARELFCKQVKVDVASHSKQMDPLKDLLRNELKKIRPVRTRTTLYSTVRAAKVDGSELNDDYWVSNLRNGVQFSETLQKICEDEHTVFIEVSPHPVLVTSIQECLQAFQSKGIVSPTLIRNKPELDWLYGHFAELYTKGLRVDWDAFYNHPTLPFVELPSYPFQRARYSVTEGKSKATESSEGHVLLGEELNLGLEDHSYVWQPTISLEDFPSLNNHKVNGQSQLPNSFFIEMAYAAISSTTGSSSLALTQLEISQAVLITEDKIKLQVRLNTSNLSFKILARSQEKWIDCVNGLYEQVESPNVSMPRLSQKSTEVMSEQFYDQLHKVGIQLGESFQTIKSIRKDGAQLEMSLQVTDEYTRLNDCYLHPILVEAPLLSMFEEGLKEWQEKDLCPYITKIDRIEVLGSFTTLPSIRALANGSDSLSICSTEGKPLVNITGVQVEISALLPGKHEYYHTEWASQKLQAQGQQYQHILLLREQHDEVSNFLIDQIESTDVAVETLTVKRDMNWVEEVKWHSPDHIVLWANGHKSNDQLTDSLDLIARAFQAIEQVDPILLKKVSILTQGGVPYKNGHSDLDQSYMAGFVKVLSNEFPGLQVTLHDLSYIPTKSEIESLSYTLINQTKYEPIVLFRNKQTIIQRLATNSPGFHTKAKIQKEALQVLIGASDDSSHVIQWLFDEGARNFLVLTEPVSFNGLEYKLRTLIESGAEIKLKKFQRKEPGSLSKILAEIPGTVVQRVLYFEKPHEAKELDEYLSDDLARNLQVTSNEILQVHAISKSLNAPMVVFKDPASLVGSRKHALGAATNTFIEALADESISICYLSTKQSEALFQSIDQQSRDYFLSPVLSEISAKIGIFSINTSELAAKLPGLTKSSFIPPKLMEAIENESSGNVLVNYHAAASTEEKVELIQNFLKATISKIIKSPADQIGLKAKFKHLGIDSLMAVQFRSTIEQSLETKLSISNIWEYATVEELAGFLHFILSDQSPQTPDTEKIAPFIFTDNLSDDNLFQLVCFHDAGGSASLFEDWTMKLGEEVGLIRVELPGRRGSDLNVDELPHISEFINMMATKLTELITTSTVFIGHSMGGLFAFEVIHELQKRGLSIPEHLFISSTPQLDSYDRSAFDSDMTEEELILRFPYLHPSNTPDEELRNFLKRILRADLALLKTYDYRKKESLSIDITCIHGQYDQSVSKEQMLKWRDEIDGELIFIERVGDHHYIKQDADFVTQLILNELPEKALIRQENDR